MYFTHSGISWTHFSHSPLAASYFLTSSVIRQIIPENIVSSVWELLRWHRGSPTSLCLSNLAFMSFIAVTPVTITWSLIGEVVHLKFSFCLNIVQDVDKNLTCLRSNSCSGKLVFSLHVEERLPIHFVFIILRPATMKSNCHIVIINYNFSLLLTTVELSRNEAQADLIYFQTLWLNSGPPYLRAMTRRSPPEAAQMCSLSVKLEVIDAGEQTSHRDRLDLIAGSSNVSAWITSSQVPASLFVGGWCFFLLLTNNSSS